MDVHCAGNQTRQSWRRRRGDVSTVPILSLSPPWTALSARTPCTTASSLWAAFYRIDRSSYYLDINRGHMKVFILVSHLWMQELFFEKEKVSLVYRETLSVLQRVIPLSITRSSAVFLAPFTIKYGPVMEVYMLLWDYTVTCRGNTWQRTTGLNVLIASSLLFSLSFRGKHYYINV